MKRYLFGGVFVSVLVVLFLNRSSDGTDYASSLVNAASGRAGANSGSDKYCKWVFDKYESSVFEQEWLTLVTTGGVNDNVCAKVAEPHHAGHITEIMGRISQLVRTLDGAIKWNKQDTGKLQPSVAVDQHMSRFHYKRLCFKEKTGQWLPASGHGVQLIEPLFGMLRDPYDMWCDKKKLQMTPEGYHNDMHAESTQHIMPMGFAPYAYSTDSRKKLTQWRYYGIPPWHSSYRAEPLDGVAWTYSPPKNMHVEIGASNFAATNNAPKWMYDHYQMRGQPFDKFVAMHREMPDAQRAYWDVPADLMGRYQVLGMSLLAAGSEIEDLRNLIKRIVKEDDFFVLKLHDNPREFNDAFMKDFLADESGLLKLVDEFYFEHQVKFSPMSSPWGLDDQHRAQVGDLGTSYKLFKTLREHGIRAHSWP